MNTTPQDNDTGAAVTAPARLLAIDDSSLIHRLLKTRLSNERLEVHSAITGEEGISMARQILPEVILLDIDLPGSSGFDVLLELQADERTHAIPVIFISGDPDPTQKVRAFEMGAIDFVMKPFNSAELRARVRSAVRMSNMIRMLAQRAQLDGLTGLCNREYFDRRLAQETSAAARHGHGIALVMCDLDHFKHINDSYGHPFGDLVLEEFAHLLSLCRDNDICCRYGGEEFAIILPQSTAEEAYTLVDRIRQRLTEIKWRDHDDVVVTASFGISDSARAESATPMHLVISADRALYKAKHNGRNRIELAPLRDQPGKQVA